MHCFDHIQTKSKMSKLQYTKDDLTLGHAAGRKIEDGIITHSHTVEFDRPLTEAERHLFADVLQGFYYTVRFSRQFGSTLVSEPQVEFVTPFTARYTLRQTSMSGLWKELLLAILTNFSLEIVPIRKHDESKAFMPKEVAA